MNQINKNKKFLSIIIVVVILISSVCALATTYVLKIIEPKEELSVTILANPSVGSAPLNVIFSSFVTNYDGDLKYQWDFGNGITSEEKEPSIIYEEGEYTCSLKVTDDSNESQINSIKIKANKNKPPIVTLYINNNTINRNFNWLEILSLTLIAKWAGNKQIFLDKVEEQKGADAWGEGRIEVTAQIMDPEDDEIVKYDWKVQMADKVVSNTLKEWLPVKNLTGQKSVKIPELYTWLDGRHIVILTVTDSAGNQATADIDFMVSASSILTSINSLGKLIVNGLPFFLVVTGILWGIKSIEIPVSNFLDGIWFDLSPMLQNVILKILLAIGWNYEPPLPKVYLEFSKIHDIDFSSYINDTSGEIDSLAKASSSFTIFNNDSNNTAQNIYVTLKKPCSAEEGLRDELEIDALTFEIIGGVYSNKLFYDGQYSIWENSYNIVQLSPGGKSTIELMVTIEEGAILKKDSYQCSLYVFQEKSLHEAEYVDEIDFIIII